MFPPPADPRLAIELAGVPLRNPVLTASGTCGYGPEDADVLDYTRLGGGEGPEQFFQRLSRPLTDTGVLTGGGPKAELLLLPPVERPSDRDQP